MTSVTWPRTVFPQSCLHGSKPTRLWLGASILRSRNYKLLVSLREDFLPHLEEWCRLIPALGRSRMRLLPLKWDEAFDAVHEPAKDLMTAALAKRVVDIVAGENLHRDAIRGH